MIEGKPDPSCYLAERKQKHKYREKTQPAQREPTGCTAGAKKRTSDLSEKSRVIEKHSVVAKGTKSRRLREAPETLLRRADTSVDEWHLAKARHHVYSYLIL